MAWIVFLESVFLAPALLTGPRLAVAVIFAFAALILANLVWSLLRQDRAAHDR